MKKYIISFIKQAFFFLIGFFTVMIPARAVLLHIIIPLGLL